METEQNTEIGDSRTDCGLLESLVEGCADQKDDSAAMKNTNAQTTNGFSEQVVGTREDIERLMEASIRTERTVVGGREDGRLVEEEEGRYLGIESTP